MRNTYIKTAFILLVILSIQFAASAQIAHTWSGGVEVGPGFSKFGGNVNGHKFNTGLIAGGFLTYSAINTFAFTFKALYTQKGTKFENSGVTIKQSLDYLEFPLIGRFFFNESGRFRPNIFIGPTLGVLLGVKNKRGEGGTVSIPAAQKKDFTNLDLGATAGLGLNYEIMNETRLLLDARYTYGLTDVANPGKIHNNTIGVTLGASFGF